jgi:hypothetical protein
MNIAGVRQLCCAHVLLWLVAAVLPHASSAVTVTFDLRTPSASPFPSNRFAAPEKQNLTGLRINLPKPDCGKFASDCNDVEVLNTLDGFNVQPRLRIPFNGPIDPRSVNSTNVFLVRLFDVSRDETRATLVTGINQVVWDPATNVLFAESNELLEPHTTYVLLVTTEVRDSTGAALTEGDFGTFLREPAAYRFTDSASSAYREMLVDAVQRAGFALTRIAAASVFTTLSTTAEMEKIRDQVRATPAAPLELALAPGGSQSIFNLSNITNLTVSRQVGTAPSFQEQPLPLASLGPHAASVSRIGFGRFASPKYQTSQQIFQSIFTDSGTPVVQGSSTVHFTLMIPAGTKPAAGWPVAVYGHGFGSHKDTLLAFAGVLATRGFVTIGINAVGHGGGPLSTITLKRIEGTPVTVPAGGRGFDQNADGAIGSFEGFDAAVPRELIGSRDGMRQTVVDLLQLIKIMETLGIDFTGDGLCDIDSSRLYYFGISLGGMYGSMLLAIDPSLRAGVSNVAGGSLVESGRLGVFRGIIPGASLASRTPSLLNLPSAAPPLFGFDENMPLRNRPVVINNVPGAIQIQDYLERREWAAQTGDPLSYSRHLRNEIVVGKVAKPFLFQFSKGDRTVPNPAATAMLRGGALKDSATYFRTDLAVAANPAVPRDPHAFLGGLLSPVTAPFALAMQTQIAEFFASDGLKVIDPDAAGTLFETPIMGALPEELNFIP